MAMTTEGALEVYEEKGEAWQIARENERKAWIAYRDAVFDLQDSYRKAGILPGDIPRIVD